MASLDQLPKSYKEVRKRSTGQPLEESDPSQTYSKRSASTNSDKALDPEKLKPSYSITIEYKTSNSTSWKRVYCIGAIVLVIILIVAAVVLFVIFHDACFSSLPYRKEDLARNWTNVRGDNCLTDARYHLAGTTCKFVCEGLAIKYRSPEQGEKMREKVGSSDLEFAVKLTCSHGDWGFLVKESLISGHVETRKIKLNDNYKVMDLKNVKFKSCKFDE